MWDLKIIDTSKSLYIAIAAALERDINSGELGPGDKLPTHRELARKVGVTVTTATRAYAEAEKRGLITAIVGKGTFVSADACINSSVLNIKQERMPIEMGLNRPLHLHENDLGPVLEKVLKKNKLHKFMQYSDPQGLPEHREVGAAWIKRFGVHATPDSVLVTAGAQHALFSIFSSLLKANERIAVDSLTYPGAKVAARRLGLRMEGVRTDDEGMIPEELDSLCKRHEIKAIYTVGRNQIPTNRQMSAARKSQIVDLIRKHNLILVENDSYGFFHSESDQTLSALAPENSIYISSVSKAFYAGLRVAFVSAPPLFYNRIAQGVVDSIMLASPLCAEIVCECIRSGVADKIIRAKYEELFKRIAIFQQKLDGHAFMCSEHCMSVWLELPDIWNSNEFELAASKKGLRIYAAEKFAVGSIAPPNCIRISISGQEDLDSFEKGLDVLVDVFNEKSPCGFVHSTNASSA